MPDSTRTASLVLALPLLCTAVAAEVPNAPPQPAAGTLIPLFEYSQEENERILKLFEGLRVADVTDAMDLVGLQDVGLMDPEIRALWRDLENFEHRVCGIAVTARYVPTNKRAGKMSPEEYKKWFGEWYGTISREAFMELLRPGTVIVIDASEDGDTGTIG